MVRKSISAKQNNEDVLVVDGTAQTKSEEVKTPVAENKVSKPRKTATKAVESAPAVPMTAEAVDGKFVTATEDRSQVPTVLAGSVVKSEEDNKAKKEEDKSRVEISKVSVEKKEEKMADGQAGVTVQPQVQNQTQSTPQVQSNRVVMNPNNNRSQYNNRTQINRVPVRVQAAPSYAESNVGVEPIVGVLDIGGDGQGLVRPKFTPSNRDAFIGSNQIKRLGLRPGDMIVGACRPGRETEKYGMITRIDKVNGMDLAAVQRRPNFNDLVPIYAQKQVKLESDPTILSTRIIDLFSPVGFGQRGMIVSPPKAGKTTLLKEIAAGVAINYPEVHLMAVLVGERPEEVTDMQRFVKGEVVASSFDQKPEEQTKAAEIAIERAKRLVEMGKDVFMVFDSITRLARAYNLAIPTSGRTLSGGFDPAALYPSKRFFGAARKIENGGSLTIIGTALVDTGSKLDDLVFEEFKGTGNMELRLTRSLAERRIFPAFDILKSGTRREELLLSEENMTKMTAVRRLFDKIEGDKEEAAIMVMEQMMKTKSNEEFMKRIGKQ